MGRSAAAGRGTEQRGGSAIASPRKGVHEKEKKEEGSECVPPKARHRVVVSFRCKAQTKCAQEPRYNFDHTEPPHTPPPSK